MNTFKQYDSQMTANNMTRPTKTIVIFIYPKKLKISTTQVFKRYMKNKNKKKQRNVMQKNKVGKGRPLKKVGFHK